MGAFRVTVDLHDQEVMRFARTALRGDAEALMGPDATYVGRRIADETPGLLDAIRRQDEVYGEDGW